MSIEIPSSSSCNIITGDEVFEELQRIDGVITDSHLIGTSGMHLKEYFDLRKLFEARRDLLQRVGHQLGECLRDSELDLIIGPETLGRELAGFAAAQLGIRSAHLSKRPVGYRNGKTLFHADYRKMNRGDDPEAEVTRGTTWFLDPKLPTYGKDNPEATLGRDWLLDPKLPLINMFIGENAVKRVAVIDDLFTTGSSVKSAIAFLMEELPKIDGVERVPEIVAAGGVIRRNPRDGSEVTSESFGVPRLVVLRDVEASTPLTPEQCAASGMCSKRVPMLDKPGHGGKFLEENPDYPRAVRRAV